MNYVFNWSVIEKNIGAMIEALGFGLFMAVIAIPASKSHGLSASLIYFFENTHILRFPPAASRISTDPARRHLRSADCRFFGPLLHPFSHFCFQAFDSQYPWMGNSFPASGSRYLWTGNLFPASPDCTIRCLYHELSMQSLWEISYIR